MLTLRAILCSGVSRRVLPAAMALASLAACGQKGDLYLPTEAAAANRRTLPQVLLPGPVTSTTTNNANTTTDPSPPAQTRDAGGGRGTGTASPVRQP
jgi:predicted small lipoprotein YifL